MKKNASLALAALMASITLLAGCGGSSAASAPASTAASSEAASTASSTAESQAPAEEVTLRYLAYDHQLDDVLAAFEESHPNIKVEVEIQTENNSTEFLKKLDLLQLSGDTYDVTCLPSYGQYASRAAKGFWEPLDSYFAAEGKDPGEYYSIDTSVDGSYYGIPGTPGIYYVIFNKDMLDEAGLDVPDMDWTWDDYAEYAAKLTHGEGTDKVYGSHMHTWTEYRRENLWCVKDDNAYVKDSKVSNLDDPAFGEWLTFIKGLEDDGYQMPYADAKATNVAYRDVFFQGKAAMMLTGSWMVNDIANTENFPHDFKTAFAPFPRWKDNEAGRCEGDSGIYVVNANSQNKDAAFELISYLGSSDATGILLNPSSVRGADNSAILQKKVEGHEDLFDLDSMIRIWNDPNLTPVSTRSHLTTFTAVDEIYSAETELYMLGSQDLETTLQNIQDKGNPIIEAMED